MLNARTTPSESGVHEVLGIPRFVLSLSELVAHVAREPSTKAAASQIAREFVDRLSARTARVYLASSDGCTLHLAAAANIDATALSEQLLIIEIASAFPACVAVRTGLLQLVLAEDAATFGRAGSPGGLALSFPLFAGSQTIGAVIAGYDDLLPKECTVLFPLAYSLGGLLDRARLRDVLQCLEAPRSEPRPGTTAPPPALLGSAGSEPNVERRKAACLHGIGDVDAHALATTAVLLPTSAEASRR